MYHSTQFKMDYDTGANTRKCGSVDWNRLPVQT